MRYIRFKKLEQFCLLVIVENLEKFIYSRNVPQKHIDFLLRVYSEEVFKKFSRKKQVSEDCMLWFLNPHCKKVTLPTVSDKITNKLQVVGSTITSLSLKNSIASENMIDAILSSIPNVVHLDLSCSQCTDNNLLCIQRMCPVLISLDLTSCRVTSDGMKNLCGIHKSIRYLDLTGNKIKNCGVAIILKEFPQLEQLRTEGMAVMLYKIHRETYTNPNIRYNLTELIYDSTIFENILKVIRVWTLLCPYVTRVYLDCYVTQKEIEMCSRFEYLKVLEIKSEVEESFPGDYMSVFGDVWPGHEMNTHVDVLAPFIPKGSSLTKLVITRDIISIQVLMGCFENLKILHLEGVTFMDFVQDDLILKENKLEVLVLKQIPVDRPATCKAIFSLVSVSTNVTTLHLSINKELPQNVFDAILNSMKNIMFFRFAAYICPQNLSFIQRIFQIPSLEVFIDDCFGVMSLGTDFGRPFQHTPLSTTLSWLHCDGDDSDDKSYYDSESDLSSDDSFNLYN